MSLDKFRKIEDSKGQFLPDNELEIYGKDPIKTSFGKWPNDTLRVIIYDGNNNPLPQKNWGLVRYINQEDFPQYYQRDTSITTDTTRKYAVDIKKLIKDAGYNIGIFTVETMFINSRLGTEHKPNRVWIQEISPSRTEVRVLPFDLGDVKYKDTNRLLSDVISERYTAFLDDEEFKEDIWESVESFLSLITSNDIRELFINRVTEQVYSQILREYFDDNINVFNQIMSYVIRDFKLAVRYELENRNSIICNNPNFGQPNTTERVSIDFPQFCFDKLIEALDCHIPRKVDYLETEIIDDVEERSFIDVRPRVDIPQVRDPNPPYIPPPNTDEPEQEEPEVEVPFDRGKELLNISVWTNLPLDVRYSDDTVSYYDSVQNIRIMEYDTIKNTIVPKDPNWIDRKLDNRLWKDIEPTSDEYKNYVAEKDLMFQRINKPFSDAKILYFGNVDLSKIVPTSSDYKEICIIKDSIQLPTVKQTIPVWYMQSNGGEEKRIRMYKNNLAIIQMPGFQYTSYSQETDGRVFGAYTNSVQVVVSNRTFSGAGQVRWGPNQFYNGGMGTQSVLEYEYWEFEGIYDMSNMSTPLYTLDDVRKVPSGFPRFTFEVTKNIDLFIKWKRKSVMLSGSTLIRPKYDDNCNPVWQDPITGQIGGVGFNAVWNSENNNTLGPAGTPGGYPEWPQRWVEKDKILNLAKITDPRQGGFYTNPTQQELQLIQSTITAGGRIL